MSITRSAADRIAAVPAPGYRFGYQTTSGPASSWSAEGLDGLAAIILTADKARATPVAVLRLREEQAFRCEYDVIIASCRDQAP